MKFLNILKRFLEKLSPREKAVFYITTFIISLTLLDRIVISPISSKVQNLNKEIQEKKINLKKSLHLLAQKDRINSEIRNYTQFLKDAKDKGDITSVLKEIEELANKIGIYILDLKPIGIRESGSIKKNIISLSCEAQMEQLMEFMYGIENSNQLLTIEKYQITPKSKESSIARCSLTITKLILP